MKHGTIKSKIIKHETENIENQSPNNSLQKKVLSTPRLLAPNKNYATSLNTTGLNSKFSKCGIPPPKNSDRSKKVGSSTIKNIKNELKYRTSFKEAQSSTSHLVQGEAAAAAPKGLILGVNDSNNNLSSYSPMTEITGCLDPKCLGRNKNATVVKANPDRVKISHKSFGIIESYAAITTEGLVRDYNEDRVSIIFNISKPQSFVESPTSAWPKCSFFGLYDGHGGSGCVDFLRDNLHKFIIGDSNFPMNPQKALLSGFLKAEKEFMKLINSNKNPTETTSIPFDTSGSCALVLLLVEKRCYIANVGDSRSIMSGSCGEKTYSLSRDHRPGDQKEYQRILDAGGKIYQTELENTTLPKDDSIIGPLRVIPGRLSVSRALGDIEAKEPKFGGNPNVVIATPEIKYFDIADNSNSDFLFIGCDGIFEKMKNKQIIDSAWNVINSDIFGKCENIHNLGGIILEKLIDECLMRKSTDNLTIILIFLKKKENLRKGKGEHQYQYASQTELISKVPKTVMVMNNNNNNNNNGTCAGAGAAVLGTNAGGVNAKNCEIPQKIRKLEERPRSNEKANQSGISKSRQPLSSVISKLLHSNTQAMTHVVNCCTLNK